MKKRKLFARYKFVDDVDVNLPLSETHRSIPSAYWDDQNGDGNHAVVELPETPDSVGEWYEAKIAADEHGKAAAARASKLKKAKKTAKKVRELRDSMLSDGYKSKEFFKEAERKYSISRATIYDYLNNKY